MSDNISTVRENAFYATGYYNNTENWEDGVLYLDKVLVKANSAVSDSYSVKSGTRVLADGCFGNSAITSV
jgi:hypothetical protein